MSQIKSKFIEDGAVTDAKVATGIDATKLADGSVTNTELQYINSVTSDVQTQLNGKQATGNYITALTGDVTASGPGSVASTIANDAVTTVKIAADAVTSAKVRLTNNAALRARNAADSADISLLKLDATDKFVLLDSSGVNSIEVTDRALDDSAGLSSIDYEGRVLSDSTATESINYQSRTLSDSSANVSIDYENGLLNDASGALSIDAYNRTLKDSSGNVIFDYESAIINSPGDGAAINLNGRTLSASTTDIFLNFENFQIYDKTNNNPALDFTAINPVLLADPDAPAPRKLVFNNEDDSFGAAVSAPVGLAANTEFVLPPDNGTAGYVLSTDGAGITSWIAAGAGVTFAKETFTVTASQQTFTLTNTPIANSVTFVVKGGAPTLEGASHDYTVATNVVTILNDLATGGAAELVNGDIVQISYSY